MANRITNKCVGCGACVTECPNGAISEVPKAPKKLFEIDPMLCDECADNDHVSLCKKVCAENCIVQADA
jgi:ferredoxin